jgi:hypothetical protein
LDFRYLDERIRQALEEFSRTAQDHPEVAGVVLYGSALWKIRPDDLDFVMLLDKAEYVHFYGVHSARGVRCEVEYVTAPVLEEYFTHPHWRTDNWELDTGVKYVNGRILYDPKGLLMDLRQRLTGPEVLKVRRYLFVHQVGQAGSRLKKLEKASAAQAPQLASEFVKAFDAAAHHARLTYPLRGFQPEGWNLESEELKALLEPGYHPLKAALLEKVEAQGLKSLGLEKLFLESDSVQQILNEVPLYHLVDYGGLERLLSIVRPDLRLPTNLMMPLFSAEFG